MKRAGEVEPPVGGLAAREAGAGLLHADGDAAATMQRRAVGVALAADGGDLTARAVAGIDQPALAQRGEGGRVIGDVLALAAGAKLVSDAEPLQVFEDRRLVFGAAAGGVGVFEAQQQAGAVARGEVGVAQRGIGVAEVK